MAQMVAVAIVSVLLLITIFKPYERLALRTVNRITRSNVNMAIFMIAILVIPLILLFF
jgi:hypothetical protein